MENFIAGFDKNIATIDQPVIGRSVTPQPVTIGSIGYVRLHGRNKAQWFADKSQTQSHPLGGNARYDYLYSDAEIQEWAAKSKTVQGQSEKTFVILNNHPWGQAVANGLQLKAALGEAVAEIPSSLQEKYPSLISLNSL